MYKTLLLACALSLGAICGAQTAASNSYPVTTELTDTNRPARVPEKGNGYRGGLTDALVHTDPGFDTSRLSATVTPEKVRRVVVMPVPNEGLTKSAVDGTTQKIQLAQAQPALAKVMCAGDYLSNWLADSQRFGPVESAVKETFQRLQTDLDSGWCLGVGELGLLHFNKLGSQNVIQNRFDAPLMLQVVDMVGSRGAWIQLHAEPREPNGRSHERELWDALSLWTQRQPKLKIMLSHTGMTSAANARKLLETFPNLYMSVKLMSSKQGNWRHLEPVLNQEGNLYEDWAQLMEAFPERFVIGSDSKFGQAGHESVGEEAYEHTIRRYKRFLGALSADAAKRIASKNAERIYGFKADAQDNDQSN